MDCRAAFEAAIDKSVTLVFTKAPPIFPKGVRFAATIKIPVFTKKEIVKDFFQISIWFSLQIQNIPFVTAAILEAKTHYNSK